MVRSAQVLPGICMPGFPIGIRFEHVSQVRVKLTVTRKGCHYPEEYCKHFARSQSLLCLTNEGRIRYFQEPFWYTASSMVPPAGATALSSTPLITALAIIPDPIR